MLVLFFHFECCVINFDPCLSQCRDILRLKVKAGETDINVMKWISRTALEFIGQGGFGHSFGALDAAKESTYSEGMKMLG